MTKTALVLVTLSCWPGRAGADSLTALGGADVVEASANVAIDVHGFVATVELRQAFVNKGAEPDELVYQLDVPSLAAVTAAAVQGDGGAWSPAAVVDAAAAIAHHGDDDGVPDLGVVRLVREPPLIGPSTTSRYEVRIAPIAAGKSVGLKLTYVVPMAYADGRLSLRLPAHGDAANLAAGHLALTLEAPRGCAGLDAVRIAERELSAHTGARSGRLEATLAPDRDLVLEARPRWTVLAPRLETAIVRTGADRGVVSMLLVDPARPATTAIDFERIVLVVDVSKSMGAAGVAAARALVAALLAQASGASKIEVILFDREARPVLGKLSANDATARGAIDQALAITDLRGGSDLGGALDAVAALLKHAGAIDDQAVGDLARGEHAPTLIAVLSDGLLPTELDGAEAANRLGKLALAEAKVSGIVIVPDAASIPPLDAGPLAELTARGDGRLLAIRPADVASRTAGLFAELAQPAPLSAITLDPATAAIRGLALPGGLDAGSAVWARGVFVGKPPKLAVQATWAGKTAAIGVNALDARAARAVGAIALAHLGEGDLYGPDEDAPAEVRAAALRQAATTAGIVSRATSLVALASGDGFGKDRLALARKWGGEHYWRIGPALERGEAGRFEPFGVALHEAEVALRPGRTGQLDRAIVQRLLARDLVPKARGCFADALVGKQRLGGHLTVVVELARGEVQLARVDDDSIGDAALRRCVVAAAYDLPVPTVAQGATGEVVYVARYPLRFKAIDHKAQVSGEDAARPSGAGADDPLEGL